MCRNTPNRGHNDTPITGAATAVAFDAGIPIPNDTDISPVRSGDMVAATRVAGGRDANLGKHSGGQGQAPGRWPTCRAMLVRLAVRMYPYEPHTAPGPRRQNAVKPRIQCVLTH